MIRIDRSNWPAHKVQVGDWVLNARGERVGQVLRVRKDGSLKVKYHRRGRMVDPGMRGGVANMSRIVRGGVAKIRSWDHRIEVAQRWRWDRKCSIPSCSRTIRYLVFWKYRPNNPESECEAAETYRGYCPRHANNFASKHGLDIVAAHPALPDRRDDR